VLTKSRIYKFGASFLSGVLFCAIIGYFIFLGPSDSRYRKLESELSAATTANKQLTDSARLRQGYLDQARGIIRSGEDTLTELGDLIKILRKADEDRSADSGN
jgi:hypothetical protein